MDFMIDLETMGTGHDAAITAIGAVAFFNGVIYSEFYRVVDLQSSMDAGGVVTASTIEWWMQQRDEARLPLYGKGVGKSSLGTVLSDFANWMREKNSPPVYSDNHHEVTVWGNGATFDLVVLSTAYARRCIERPWSYKGERCYRTINALFGQDIPFEREGTYHNALDDARSQALHLIKILKGKA